MKKEISLAKITKKGKCLFLAYDQGLEHGPTDFNDENADPEYIIEIAKKGKYTGLIVQKGIAEKYAREIRASKVPLILKLNGKTNLVKDEPLSTQLCTVKEARTLGATAVGYTIYIGSAHEAEMFAQFEQIEREAHEEGMPVIAWVYPRGKSIESRPANELMAYSARTALELGADMVKLHWTGTFSDLQWAVKAAGRCRVVVAGGLKDDESSFLEGIQTALKTGIAGFAIGRNIWQARNPLELTKKVKERVWALRPGRKRT